MSAFRTVSIRRMLVLDQMWLAYFNDGVLFASFNRGVDLRDGNVRDKLRQRLRVGVREAASSTHR